MEYQLTNSERIYLGLDPIQEGWDYVEFKADKYRPKSILVFEGQTIKRHIISTNESYIEKQYDDLTKERTILLPKTKRGKEKKLTPSTFENITPKGVYFNYSLNHVQIASFTTQTTFYSTRMEELKIENISQFKIWLKGFVNETNESNKLQLKEFVNAKRKNVRAKAGDVFAFKVDRNNYGFGQVIENIGKIRKELPEHHSLNNLMGQPLLVKLFHYLDDSKNIDISIFKTKMSTPSQYIFDNHIFYGQYPIIGNCKIDPNELDYPISYGKVLNGSPEVYFQWGFIHIQKPLSKYDKHLTAVNSFVPEDSPNRITNNAYAKNGVGFQLDISKSTLLNCISNENNNAYWSQKIYQMNTDLRNPINRDIKSEIFKEFGVDESLTYTMNLRQRNNEL